MSETKESTGRGSGSLSVSGDIRKIVVEPRTTLLDALREELGLTGTKKACDRGECGACTVHVDGRRILSCMTLAVRQEGKRITTIEGLERNGELDPVQAAFIEHDGFQCGFCTSGQIMSASAVIEEAKAGWPSAATADVRRPFTLADLSKAEIRERMSGNLCRCACYPDINGLPDMARIEVLSDGGLRIGALARMSDVAADPEVRRRFPVIGEALLSAASGQLPLHRVGMRSNRATVRQKKTGRPVRFELTEQTRQALDDYIKAAGKKPVEFLFSGRGDRNRCMTTQQYARGSSRAGLQRSASTRTFSARIPCDAPKRRSFTVEPATYVPCSCCWDIRRSRAPSGISVLKSMMLSS